MQSPSTVRTVKVEASGVSSELGEDTSAQAAMKVSSVRTEQMPWLVRGQDEHVQFDENDSKTFGGDEKRHFYYKLKDILSHRCAGTDVNKAGNMKS